MAADTGNWVGLSLTGGRFQVLAKLGSGGMAHVYRAADQQSRQEVVIKVPRLAMLEDPDFTGRFTREVRSLARLTHENIVRVIGTGEHDLRPFVVLQYLPGGSLRDRLTAGVRSLDDLRTWLPKIAAALDFCHRNQCLHRDVKPDNILFDGKGRPFLGDFGIAKVLYASAKTRVTVLTGTGMVLGTPQYMAPELIMGQKYDGRVDQYGLAVTVYEMVSGRVPIEGNNPAAILVQQTTQEPPPLHTIVPSIPRQLSEAVQRALSKDPKDRYSDCTGLATAVLGVLSAHPIQPAHSREAADRTSSRKKTTAAKTSMQHQTNDKNTGKALSVPQRNTVQQPAPKTLSWSVWSIREKALLGIALCFFVALLVWWFFARSTGSRHRSIDPLDYIPAAHASLWCLNSSQGNLNDLLQWIERPFGLTTSEDTEEHRQLLTEADRVIQSNTGRGTITTVTAILTRSRLNQERVKKNLALDPIRDVAGVTVYKVRRMPDNPRWAAFPDDRLVVLSDQSGPDFDALLLAAKQPMPHPAAALIQRAEPSQAWGLTLLTDDMRQQMALPPGFAHLLPIARQSIGGIVKVDFLATGGLKIELELSCADVLDAKAFQTGLEQYWQAEGRAKLKDAVDVSLASEPWAKKANLDRISEALRDSFTVQQQGSRTAVVVRLSEIALNELRRQRVIQQEWRQSWDKLSQLAGSIRSYLDRHSVLPWQSSKDPQQKPLLSWRVHVLPFMGAKERELHQQFNLGESWDSRQNSTLIDRMPDVYRSPFMDSAVPNGKTTYVLPIGGKPFWIYPGKSLQAFEQVDKWRDKVMLIDADDSKAVYWTQPEDLRVDFTTPKAGVQRTGIGAVVALYDQGHRILPLTIPDEVLGRMLTGPEDEVTKSTGGAKPTASKGAPVSPASVGPARDFAARITEIDGTKVSFWESNPSTGFSDISGFLEAESDVKVFTAIYKQGDKLSEAPAGELIPGGLASYVFMNLKTLPKGRSARVFTKNGKITEIRVLLSAKERALANSKQAPDTKAVPPATSKSSDPAQPTPTEPALSFKPVVVSQGWTGISKKQGSDVREIAAGIKSGNKTGAELLAQRTAMKFEELADVMCMFKPRSKGGLGVGVSAQGISDGIEIRLRDLARGAPKSTVTGLEQLGYDTAAIALLTKSKAPRFDMGKKRVSDFSRWADDLYDAGVSMAREAKGGAQGMKASAGRANSACNSCHAVFRE